VKNIVHIFADCAPIMRRLRADYASIMRRLCVDYAPIARHWHIVIACFSAIQAIYQFSKAP
jgi:hypothetical protein